jgi:hypothetical protein
VETKPFVTNTWAAIIFAVEVASELLKMHRNTSNSTFCVFAAISRNLHENLKIQTFLPTAARVECRNHAKRKEMMQNGGVIASGVPFELVKGARLNRDRTIWDGHKTPHRTSRA